MRVLLRTCLLAATLASALLLSLPSEAQANPQKSPPYQKGYQRGIEDRGDNREPDAGFSDSTNGADRLAYESGYRAGYCHVERNKTGYYNGIYRAYGPPVIRNGYYGYNAPTPYCENDGGNAARRRGNPEAPQNRVEYGGGG